MNDWTQAYTAIAFAVLFAVTAIVSGAVGWFLRGKWS